MLGERALTPARAQALLADLRGRALNFDPAGVVLADGWHLDDLRQPLPDGSWEVARELMRRYKVADPAMVRAFYDESEPLEGRTMLLELRFLGLRFPVGVRVGDVYEGARVADGRPAHVAGWNYRTLEGHLEIGQLAWELWRWEDTGAVEFRIHAFSRRAPTDSLLVRIGVRLFARREQLRFYRRSCARMLALTRAASASPAPPAGPSPGAAGAR